MGSDKQNTTTSHKNETHLAGVLARDPETRYTATGKTVSNLTVLTKHQEKSEFHRVTCWEGLAEKVGTLHKGDFVELRGRLQTRSWEDKDSKQKRYITEIVAWQLTVPAGKESAAATPVQTTNVHGLEVTDDDIPF